MMTWRMTFRDQIVKAEFHYCMPHNPSLSELLISDTEYARTALSITALLMATNHAMHARD